MDFTDHGAPWNEMSDIAGEHDADPAQLAFAAYESAWNERVRTGITAASLLIAALEARRVPPSEYVEGTRLHKALFSSWDKGKPSNRLQWVMARYRLQSAAAAPKELFAIFKDTTPDWIQIPDGYKKMSNWPQDEDAEETALPFTADEQIEVWLPRWFDGVAEDYEPDDRHREFPAWLRPLDEPNTADVMVGEQRAGIAELPPWAYETLTSAKVRKKNRVAHGGLSVKRRTDGTFRVDELSIELPTHG